MKTGKKNIRFPLWQVIETNVFRRGVRWLILHVVIRLCWTIGWGRLLVTSILIGPLIGQWFIKEGEFVAVLWGIDRLSLVTFLFYKKKRFSFEVKWSKIWPAVVGQPVRPSAMGRHYLQSKQARQKGKKALFYITNIPETFCLQIYHHWSSSVRFICYFPIMHCGPSSNINTLDYKHYYFSWFTAFHLESFFFPYYNHISAILYSNISKLTFYS